MKKDVYRENKRFHPPEAFKRILLFYDSSMKNQTPKHFYRGFTIVELLVTLAIFAVIVGIAVPAMQGFSRSLMVVGAITDLSSDLQYARAEAVARKTSISICASTDGASCSNSDDWLSGWIISIDDASECPAAGDCILRAAEGLNAALIVNASTANSISFDEEGATNGAVTFAICLTGETAAADNRFLRTLTLRPSGSRQIQNGAASCDP